MPASSHELRGQFLLDPDVVFLNHGSFGACPKPVFETFQRWQLDLERQPVEFLGRRVDDLLAVARTSLGSYLNAPADDLIFVPNATTGINIVARSLALNPGDEILTSDQEYGAMDYTWEFVCRKTGARYIHHPIPLPVTTTEDFVEHFWQAVTPRTRVIFLSHITSPTALIYPIEEICRRARAAGILTVIDGAHAPGQIPLDLQALDVDFYSGNCHKWLCAPKGSAFLYVRPEHQTVIEPMVISWGYTEGANFVTRNQWQGTRDVSAFLTVPAAIQWQADHDWDAVREQCHALATDTRQQLAELTNLPQIAPASSVWYRQMFTAPLPDCDPVQLKSQLYEQYKVEVPLVNWNGRDYVRVSIQGYTTREETDTLLTAMKNLLKL